MSTPFLSSQVIIIDHSCADLKYIPDIWLAGVQSGIKPHYAHTSHGGQVTAGLERLANPTLPAFDSRLAYKLEFKTLPTGPDLCIMDGQLTETYITPELYWKNKGDDLTRNVLNTFRTINVSMWAWCTQLDYYSESEVDEYLNSMSDLEKNYPQVKFVYMTGNAQATGAAGYNRHLRNEQIRRFCREHNKILFDFADLDAWHNNEQATYDYNGRKIPVEHPLYHGGEAGHTTFSSCEIKARALWWMLARIAGWDEKQTSSDCDCNGDGVVNEKDLLLKRAQVFIEFRSRTGMNTRSTEADKGAVIDRIDLINLHQSLWQELQIWAQNCGFSIKN